MLRTGIRCLFRRNDRRICPRACLHIYFRLEAGFYFPGLLGIATAFFWLLSFTRLQSDGTNTVSALNVEMETDYTIKLPALFLQASLIPILLAIILHGILRDGITTWMPAYITETFGLSTSLSILTTAVLPIFSIFSITIASWLLQKLHNELFTAGILFVIGTLSSLLLLPFYQSLPVFSITMMTLITGCMYGINPAAHQPGSPAFCQIRPGCYHIRHTERLHLHRKLSLHLCLRRYLRTLRLVLHHRSLGTGRPGRSPPVLLHLP